jgi:hypothetical protein
MLNITELRKQFQEIRASISVKEIQEWLDFAERRELVDRLCQGEVVSLPCVSVSMITLEEKKILIEGISSIDSFDEYAIAA